MIAPANVAPPPVAIYNLPDLKRHVDDQIAFELYQIVESVEAHIPVPKQDTVSLLLIIHYWFRRSRLLNLLL